MSDTVPSAPSRRLLPGLRRDNLLREAMAGVTLLALSVPLNIGYAQIAGLPASAGLYALIVPSLLFALVASTRQVVVAPDAAAAALVASSLAGISVASVAGPEAYAMMAAAQAVLGGLLFLVCGVLKLGFLADFLSRPILVGFVGGLALEVGLSQVAKMLGIRLGEGEFFEQVWSLFREVPQGPRLVGGRQCRLPGRPAGGSPAHAEGALGADRDGGRHVGHGLVPPRGSWCLRARRDAVWAAEVRPARSALDRLVGPGALGGGPDRRDGGRGSDDRSYLQRQERTAP